MMKSTGKHHRHRRHRKHHHRHQSQQQQEQLDEDVSQTAAHVNGDSRNAEPTVDTSAVALLPAEKISVGNNRSVYM